MTEKKLKTDLAEPKDNPEEEAQEGQAQDGAAPQKMSKSQSVNAGKNPFEYLTKEELERTMDFPVPEHHYEVLKDFLACSVTDFVKNYLDSDGMYPMKKFMEERGEKEVQDFGWKKPSESYDDVKSDLNPNTKNPNFAAIPDFVNTPEALGKPVLRQRTILCQF